MKRLSDPDGVLLWDLDGTLVDTRKDLAAGVNSLLAEVGCPALLVDQVTSHIGKGARNLVTRCLQDAAALPESPEERDDLLQRFYGHYDAHLLDSTQPYPHVVETLTALRDQGRVMAVVTNKPDLISKRLISELGLDSCFALVVGDGVLPVRKPDPAPLFYALERCAPDVPLDQVVMIGDSLIDIESGHKAGVKVCGVGWGFGDSALMRNAGVDWWLESPEGLSQMIGGAGG